MSRTTRLARILVSELKLIEPNESMYRYVEKASAWIVQKLIQYPEGFYQEIAQDGFSDKIEIEGYFHWVKLILSIVSPHDTMGAAFFPYNPNPYKIVFYIPWKKNNQSPPKPVPEKLIAKIEKYLMHELVHISDPAIRDSTPYKSPPEKNRMWKNLGGSIILVFWGLLKSALNPIAWQLGKIIGGTFLLYQAFKTTREIMNYVTQEVERTAEIGSLAQVLKYKMKRNPILKSLTPIQLKQILWKEIKLPVRLSLNSSGRKAVDEYLLNLSERAIQQAES